VNSRHSNTDQVPEDVNKGGTSSGGSKKKKK
jgi:hypothetical protein